ncbi:hypothetical protein BH24ACI5_BH24ACI5_26070 [soil metagenome]|jgi:hypothetical protein
MVGFIVHTVLSIAFAAVLAVADPESGTWPPFELDVEVVE